MPTDYLEEEFEWTVKGIFRSTTYRVHRRRAIHVESSESTPALPQSQESTPALPQSQESEGSPRNSGSPKPTRQLPSSSPKPTRKLKNNGSPKSTAASPQPPQQGKRKISMVHLPSCPHILELLRNGCVRRSKLRSRLRPVKSEPHYYLVCRHCNIMARAAAPAVAVNDIFPGKI